MSERLSHHIRKVVRERQHFRCALCGGEHPPGSGACISIHHDKPRAKKGSDDPGNLVGLCRGEGSNECHNLVDTLTFDKGIRFSQLMEPSVEYVIGALNSTLEKPELLLHQDGLPLYPLSQPAAQESAFFDEPNHAQNFTPQTHADSRKEE